jgi:hydroxyacylglutathione hydrolase
MTGAAMEVRTRAVGPWPMNAYALVCRATGQSVLIDPGAEPATLLALLTGTTPVAILITHTHGDHIGALDEMRARLGVPVLAFDGPHWQGLALPVDRGLADGDTIAVGRATLRAYHAPGHCPDLLAYAVAGDWTVIAGDAVFVGGPGKTWSVESFQTTLRTLRQVVLRWPDEAVCYPGHGPAFRLGDRRAAIEAFLARDHGDFFGDATWS